jgi:hypothetical protein
VEKERLPSLTFPSELLGSGRKYDQYLRNVPQVWKAGVGTSARSLSVVSGIEALGCQAAFPLRSFGRASASSLLHPIPIIQCDTYDLIPVPTFFVILWLA